MTNIARLVAQINLAQERNVSFFICRGTSVLPIIKILMNAGYVSHYAAIGSGVYNVYLDTFGNGYRPKYRLVSTPGKRIYLSFKNIHKKYKDKFVIVSTSNDLVSNQDNHISSQKGGEILIEIK